MSEHAVSQEPEDYLEPTPLIDSDHPEIVAYAEGARGDAVNDVDKAVRLYYAVREDIRYDPYTVDLGPDGFKASRCWALGRGFCVTKGAVLAAVARASGIPARVGYADVRNHLASQRLLDIMGTDLFIYHGYTDLFLDGRWVKATPAFNLALCEKFRVLPLEFDGIEDSLFHPFDADGRKHMEYVRDHGTFAEVPAARIVKAFRDLYGPVYDEGVVEGDLGAEAEAEARVRERL